MPRSRAWVKPSRPASAWIFRRGVDVVELRLRDPSHPSHCASSVPVQSEASPAKSRRVPPSASHASSFSTISAARAAGPTGLGIDVRLVRLAAPALHHLQQLREGVAELLDPVLQEVVRDLREGDPRLVQRRERGPRSRRVLLEAGPRAAVIAERGEGVRRHRVHGVGADQLLDVEDVRVARVLGARARPEDPLRPGALLSERLPSRAGEDRLVALVRQLGVGDRDLAPEALEPRLVRPAPP